jgi:hypothetical protein
MIRRRLVVVPKKHRKRKAACRSLIIIVFLLRSESPGRLFTAWQDGKRQEEVKDGLPETSWNQTNATSSAMAAVVPR